MASRSSARANNYGLPRLLALSDFASHPDSLKWIEALCEEARPGTVGIVLRDRGFCAAHRLRIGQQLSRVVRNAGQSLLVADRLDLGILLDADGIHLGASAVHPSRLAVDVRKGAALGRLSWLSRSIHGLFDLPTEELRHLDAVLVSPVFAALKNNPALGEAGLRDVQDRLKQRLVSDAPACFALGRVNEKNVERALATGVYGVACISAIFDANTRLGLLRSLNIRR